MTYEECHCGDLKWSGEWFCSSCREKLGMTDEPLDPAAFVFDDED